MVPRIGSKSKRARMKISCFSGEDTLKSWAETKFEAKPVEIAPFRTERTVGPKSGPYPKPYFRAEIGNLDDASQEISSRQVNLPSFKSDGHSVQKLWASVFWVPKNGGAQNQLCHPHNPNFIAIFCRYRGSNRILKIWAKFTKPISFESATKFGA